LNDAKELTRRQAPPLQPAAGDMKQALVGQLAAQKAVLPLAAGRR
jgi:hypothetical protein